MIEIFKRLINDSNANKNVGQNVKMKFDRMNEILYALCLDEAEVSYVFIFEKNRTVYTYIGNEIKTVSFNLAMDVLSNYNLKEEDFKQFSKLFNDFAMLKNRRFVMLNNKEIVFNLYKFKDLSKLESSRQNSIDRYLENTLEEYKKKDFKAGTDFIIENTVGDDVKTEIYAILEPIKEGLCVVRIFLDYKKLFETDRIYITARGVLKTSLNNFGEWIDSKRIVNNPIYNAIITIPEIDENFEGTKITSYKELFNRTVDREWSVEGFVNLISDNDYRSFMDEEHINILINNFDKLLIAEDCSKFKESIT